MHPKTEQVSLLFFLHSLSASYLQFLQCHEGSWPPHSHLHLLFPKWRCAFLSHCKPRPWLFQIATQKHHKSKPLRWAKSAASMCAVNPIASKWERLSWYQTTATLPALKKLQLFINQMQTTTSVITFLKIRNVPIIYHEKWNNCYPWNGCVISVSQL